MRISRDGERRNTSLVVAGTITMIQAILLFIVSGLGIAHYYCWLDFLRTFPTLIFIKILYFQTPNHCDQRISIGSVVPGISSQAFVLISREPITVLRTFIINCVGFGISIIWGVTCYVYVRSARRYSYPVRWPWVLATAAVTAVDMISGVIYINDTFYTRTLNDLVTYIGAQMSGVGNVVVDTSAVAWVMALVYSRFGLFLVLNIILIIVSVVKFNKPHRKRRSYDKRVNARVHAFPSEEQFQEQIQRTVDPAPEIELNELPTTVVEDETADNVPNTPVRIPRAGFNKSFNRIKNFLFTRTPSPLTQSHRVLSSPSLPVEIPPSPRPEFDKKRSVNFPENLLSIPQRLENMIAEQQRRLDQAIIDTSGRLSPTRASQSLPHLSTTQDSIQSSDDLLNSISKRGRRRRSTVAELQGQLPWSYTGSSTNRMRDNLPPDEDLPPVPLPDYTAVDNRRAWSCDTPMDV